MSTPQAITDSVELESALLARIRHLLEHGRLEQVIDELEVALVTLNNADSDKEYLELARVQRALGVAYATLFDLRLHQEQDRDTSEPSHAQEAYAKAEQAYQASQDALVVALEYYLDATTYTMESAVTASCLALLHFEEASHGTDHEERPRDIAAAITEMYEAHDLLRDCTYPKYELWHLIRMTWMVGLTTRRALSERMFELTAPGSGLESYRASVRLTVWLGRRVQRTALRRFLKESSA